MALRFRTSPRSMARWRTEPVPDHSPRQTALTEALRSIGPRWREDIRAAGDQVKALYHPYLAEAPRTGITIIRDTAYGRDPRQVVDVYGPQQARAAPVVAFVHGGAFVRGERNINDQMYGNVLIWFARQGFVGVNIEYRLAPQTIYPGGAEDVASACRWIHTNIAQHGGDPEQVFLIGHSAGGTHVAAALTDPRLAGQEPQVSAAVVVSARLQADALPANPNAAGVQAYFGVDESLYAERSPLAFAHRLRVPTLIVNAEYENPLLDGYGLAYAAAVAQAQGRAPIHLTCMDHNHVSVIAHFNTREEWLGRQIIDFFLRSRG